MEDWKDLFYKEYVSSGISFQENITEADMFRPLSKYIINRFFPKDKDAIIFDIGCGTGAFLYTAKKLGYSNVEGVDISAEQIAIAKRFGLDYCRQENIFETIVDIPENSKNVVLLMDVLEHCTKSETIMLLKQILRILKPDGILIMHVPNSEGVFGSKVRYADFTHETAYTATSANQLLTVVGFKANQTYEDKPIRHSFFSTIRYVLWQLLTFQYRVLHLVESASFNVHLSQNILVVARK